MLKGIHLTLLIGPAVPVIAPKVVMDALNSIQVTNSKDSSGFQISFSVSKTSPLITTMLPAGYFDPITTRVIIIATLNGMPNVLMDGFVTNHELSPSSEVGKSTLTITGEDVSLAMDLVELVIPYPAMPDSVKVLALLAPFAFLGVVPVVIPPIIDPVKIPVKNWDTMVKKTSKGYLKFLAERCGYVFFVQAGPLPGQNIGYFGPDINLPIPQPALTINMDAHSNVEALSFSLNGMAKKINIYTIFDPITQKVMVPIPVPNINVLKPPLGLRPLPPSKIGFADNTAKLFPDTAAQKIIGDLMSSSNNPPSVTGNGSLDVMRYNGLLRARMLVGVRGAGITYDGMYYVDSVTHNIKPGEYKQNFTLSRDGVISNTPKVLV
jgi:hypothetical protein